MNFSVPQLKVLIISLRDKIDYNLKIIRNVPETEDDLMLIQKASNENKIANELLINLQAQYDKATSNRPFTEGR
jgi:hypothetical protein